MKNAKWVSMYLATNHSNSKGELAVRNDERAVPDADQAQSKKPFKKYKKTIISQAVAYHLPCASISLSA